MSCLWEVLGYPSYGHVAELGAFHRLWARRVDVRGAQGACSGQKSPRRMLRPEAHKEHVPQGSLRSSLVLKEEGGDTVALLRGNRDTQPRTRVRPAEGISKACELL